MYRVQVGAYKRKGNASNRAAYVYEVTHYANIKAYKQRKQKVQEGWPCFIEQNPDGRYCVYCGSFSVKANADKRSTDLSYLYEINNFIKEV
jgi:cell division protein FtsN